MLMRPFQCWRHRPHRPALVLLCLSLFIAAAGCLALAHVGTDKHFTLPPGGHPPGHEVMLRRQRHPSLTRAASGTVHALNEVPDDEASWSSIPASSSEDVTNVPVVQTTTTTTTPTTTSLRPWTTTTTTTTTAVPTPSPAPPSTSRHPTTVSTGAIVGAVVGAVGGTLVLALLLTLLCVCCCGCCCRCCCGGCCGDGGRPPPLTPHESGSEEASSDDNAPSRLSFCSKDGTTATTATTAPSTTFATTTSATTTTGDQTRWTSTYTRGSASSSLSRRTGSRSTSSRHSLTSSSNGSGSDPNTTATPTATSSSSSDRVESSDAEGVWQGWHEAEVAAAVPAASSAPVDAFNIPRTDRGTLTEANVQRLYGDDEEARLRAINSVRYHRSQGMSEDESVLLHLYRHSATSDPAFGVFLEDADEPNSA